MTNIGQRLLEFRIAKNLSTRDLEVLSGVGKSTISRIEKGQSPGNPETIHELEIVLEALATRQWKKKGESLEVWQLQGAPILGKTQPQMTEKVLKRKDECVVIQPMDTQSTSISVNPSISSGPTFDVTPTIAESSSSTTETALKETGAGSLKSPSLPLESQRQPLTAPQIVAMCNDVLRQYRERGFSMLPLCQDYARCVWTLMDEVEFALKAVDFSEEFLSFLKRNRVYVFSVPHRGIVLGLDLPGKGNYIPFGYGSYLRIGEAAYEKRDFCIAEMLKKSSIEIKKGF